MHLTMFEIPVALEAFKASKEVLVRRPAPPGIRPFLEKKRSIQGGLRGMLKTPTRASEFTHSFIGSAKAYCLRRLSTKVRWALSSFDHISLFASD